MYKLMYLPAARQDMVEIVTYISQVLLNPTAANKLATELLEAGERIADCPYVNSVHALIQPLKHEYRRVLVRNYTMFYWVDEENKEVTVARVIYCRRNFPALLK